MKSLIKPLMTTGPRHRDGSHDTTTTAYSRTLPGTSDIHSMPTMAGRIPPPPPPPPRTRPRGRLAAALAPLGALLVLALVGGLAARAAGWGSVATTARATTGGIHQARAAAPAAVTAPAPTKAPATAPQHVGVPLVVTPAPTSTPVPPPPPTATPIPTLPITFTCGSAHAIDPGVSDGYYASLCLTSAPNATINFAITYCPSGRSGDVFSVMTDASGHYATDSGWHFATTCPLPFTITLSGTGGDAAGDQISGSYSFTVTG